MSRLSRRQVLAGAAAASAALTLAKDAGAAEATKAPQPEVHIRADRHVHYETVAKVMAVAAKAGLVRIGFVSDPAP